MAIDPSIPLQTQSFDMLGMLGRGSELAKFYAQQKTDGELNRIYNESQGDLTKMLDLGKQSKLARFVVPQIQSQISARNKSYTDQLKAEADIANIVSQSKERLANAGKTNQETGLAKYNTTLDVWRSALDNPKDGQLTLMNKFKSGAIDQDTFDNLSNQLSILLSGSPVEAKKIIDNQIRSMLDPKYQYADANTVANNAQSDKNSQRTYDASIHSTDVGADTADKNRVQQGEQFNQTLDFNKAKELVSQQKGKVQLFGDKAYFIDEFGKATPVSGVDGRQLIGAKSETPIQKIERQEKALGYADSAKSAADASVLAANLANDLKGLNGTAGGFGVFAKIPGSPQRAYASKIETLKSQVFLNQIAKMRGLGALTDAEGARLEKSIASLDINLEPSVLQANLTEIAKVMSQVAVRMNKTTQIYTGGNGSNSQTPQVNSYSFMP